MTSSDRPAPVVRDYYDTVAADWDRTYGAARQNSHFASRWRRELEHALEPVRGAAVALELGAGTGAYVAVTAPFFGRLVATDLSEGMLDVFRARLSGLALPNVELRQLDAMTLDGIADSSVDVIYSLGLLETLPDLGVHMRACARALKSGGTVIGLTSNGDCPWYALRWRLQGGSRHGRQQALARPSSLRRDLGAAGFVDARLRTWGVVPPGMSDGAAARALAAIEPLVEATPLRRWLGVMTFTATKAPQP